MTTTAHILQFFLIRLCSEIYMEELVFPLGSQVGESTECASVLLAPGYSELSSQNVLSVVRAQRSLQGLYETRETDGGGTTRWRPVRVGFFVGDMSSRTTCHGVSSYASSRLSTGNTCNFPIPPIYGKYVTPSPPLPNTHQTRQ